MSLKNRTHLPTDDWSAFTFLSVYPDPVLDQDPKHRPLPLGYVLITDPKYKANAQWKVPGGHKCSQDKNALETARRELLDETGIGLAVTAFREVHAGHDWKNHPSPHWWLLFEAQCYQSDLVWMHTGEDGELPQFFTVAQFYELVRENKVVWYYYKRLVDAGLIIPLGRDGR